MKISSLLTGIVIGAAATNMLTKNSPNGSMGQMADMAKEKMMDFTMMGMNMGGDRDSERPTASSNHTTAYQTADTSGVQAQTYSKESNMKMIKDFIKENPDVKNEVDMILKETNTIIPGI
ncbi:hypothetical protein [Paenibacillus sp. CMAA1364]